MSNLNTLLKRLPALSEARMVTNGFCVWIAWETELNPAVHQTLSDYGGMLVARGRRQSLWFFFSSDVALALARLEVWARLNPIPVFIQLLPAKLLLGMKLEVSVSMDSVLTAQEAMVPNEFQVLVHSKVKEKIQAVPGLSFTDATPMQGLASVAWKLLQADPRLPYQSSLGWYVVLKPLGNPLDKAFQNGWRAFFEELEILLKRFKLKYLIHDFFLMFPLENLRQLRVWCKEFLRMVHRVKEESPEQHWPCVLAVANKRGLNFNNELPTRVPLDWDQLMPDFPYMSYRTAFLLGEGFSINDVRFSADQSNVDDWCNISLSGDLEDSVQALQVELPPRLVAGQNPYCFYCGLRGHVMQDCPSRGLSSLKPEIWEQVASLDFESMRQALAAIDKHLAANAEDGVQTLLEGSGTESDLIRALFEINAPVQFRMLRTVFRSLGKDYPRGLKHLGPAPSDEIWEAMDLLAAGEQSQADRLLNQIVLKNPSGYQPVTLQGVSAMLKGDPVRAATLWKESEGLASRPLQQGMLVFLQGRAAEISGKYQVANSLYKQVLFLCPRWLDAVYRQGVCLVKMGFAEQAMSFFEDLIARDPHMFNRVLFDPELERGHIQLLTALHATWTSAETLAQEELRNIEIIRKDGAKWFDKDHPFYEALVEKISNLAKLGDIHNFVAFQRLAQGRHSLGRELQGKVEEEIGTLRKGFEESMERLKAIRGEASWFPFPRILVDFNKDFNFCARNLNWALRQHFDVADKFRKGKQVIEVVDAKLKDLEKRLKSLKIVRDATLFILVMGKGFFWLELIGLLLALLLLPVGIYMGQKMGYDWASGLVLRQKWELQKGLIIILSILALALATLRTALVFEKKKRKLFEEFDRKEASRGR